MKKFEEPTIEKQSFDVIDSTNDFGGDNEVSASSLFNNISIDW